MQIHFPIRARIVFLLAGALTASLASYLWIGSKLLIEDKTSYIYDYDFSQTRLLSHTLESKLSPLIEFARKPDPEKRIDPDVIGILADAVRADWIAVKNPGESAPFKTIYQIQNAKGPLSPIMMNPGQILALEIDPDKKVLRFGYALPSGKAIFSNLSLSQSPFEGLGKSFEVDLVDPRTGKALFRKTPTISEAELSSELSKGTFKADFLSGVRDASIQGNTYLVAYQYVLSGQLLILSLIPKSAAFSAARQLIIRSTILGISIFMLALGLTLLLIRGLIARIRNLVEATEKIAQGDFSTHLKDDFRTKDEVTTLAHSFNLMSAKIQQLLVETAGKARMEKELETAQLVQNTFFPSDSFEENGVRVRGRTITASECGGDFWQYVKIQDRVLLLMGDVTGHGASAALVTAAIHGAFSWFVKTKQQSAAPLEIEKDLIRPLIETLHHTLVSSAKGIATFPCLIGVIDLKSKRMFYVNASHPMPYLFRKGASKYEAVTSEQNLPQMGQESVEGVGSVKEVDLGSGTDLLWYTDGLFDARSSDGKKIKKKDFLDQIGSKVAEQSSDPFDHAISLATEHFGTGTASSAPDDITIIHVECR